MPNALIDAGLLQLDFLQWVFRGGARLHPQSELDLERIIALTKRYRDRPMDLADASLVAASERLGVLQIISLDRDFDIYRSGDKKRSGLGQHCA